MLFLSLVFIEMSTEGSLLSGRISKSHSLIPAGAYTPIPGVHLPYYLWLSESWHLGFLVDHDISCI